MPVSPDPRPPASTPASTAANRPEGPQLSAPERVNKDVSGVALDGGMLDGRSREAPAQHATAAMSLPIRGQAGCDELSDTDLMLRLQAGDESAFEVLVERFRRPLIGFMYRMAQNQAVAEELAQEVFLRVYRSRASYAAEAKFSTWLYRIATNLGLNHVRDNRRERMQPSVSLDEPQEEGRPLDVADTRPTAEEDIVRDERMAAIRRHVEELPEKQRLAVIMHKYQDLDYREISKVLKMSESATKSLLFRAYETLREKLKAFV